MRILSKIFFLKGTPFIYLFIYLWLCWVFVSVRGLSLVAASGGHSSLRCAGLTIGASLVAEHRLQTRRLSSCGSRAQLLHGMWDPPRPGLEPMSPALAGRFSTTAPPGKPRILSIKKKKFLVRFFFNVLTFRDVSPSHIQQQELFHEESGILALGTPVGSSQMLLREPFEYGKNKK